MLSLALALALLAQQAGDGTPPAEEMAPVAVAPPADRIPAGAPKEDYPFVAWCYGALRGYLDLHDELMPEVTRIEGQFRRPGATLADDLKVYAEMQRVGRNQLKTFQAALTAAEKASVRPINTAGAAAVKQGRNIWTAGPEFSKARRAQEWMSWTLPARCERVAASLEARSKLMGATLKANAEPEAAEAGPEEAPAQPAEGPASEIEPKPADSP